MNIIIVGGGKLGFSLAKTLTKEGHDITIIDNNPSALRTASNQLDVNCVQGNGTDVDAFQAAGVQGCDLAIAVTGKDEINILSCLIARKMGALQTVARVRDPQFSRSTLLLRSELGLSMQVNPELEAALEISRILRFPAALKVDFLARGRVEVVEVRLPEGSPLAGCSLNDFKSRHVKVLVCAVRRGDDVHIPNGDFVLQAGDIIFATAMPQDITAFFRVAGLMKSRKVRSVMIVGGGRTSYYLTRLLLDSDMTVKIIERSRDRCKELAAEYPAAMIIQGDGSDRETLQEENIDDADAFVAMTGMDEENVVISMYANTRKVSKVVTKINHIGFSEILDQTGIDCTITPHLLSTNQIVRYVRALQNSLGSPVESLVRLVDDRVEALEFHVQESFRGCGVPLTRLAIKKGILIACIIRKGRVIYPHGSDTISAGDSVILITTQTGINDLNEILV